MTTAPTLTPNRLLRHAPADWKPTLTRVVHVDGQAGTFVGNSQPLPGVAPRSWLGVLVKFDGGTDQVDVDPADLTVTSLRDPFAAIAGRIPTRYAPGASDDPYYPYPSYPATRKDTWYPVIYYPAGEVVAGEGPIWLVEPYPAARADGTDGLDPVDGAGVAVLRGPAAPRPRGDDPDGDWIVAGRARRSYCAYDVYVTNQRDLLAGWCEAWAIAAALNDNTTTAMGVKPEDVEVLLAAERRDLIGDSRFTKTGIELRWAHIDTDPRLCQRVPARQAGRLRRRGHAVIEACLVVDQVSRGGASTWQETTYQLTPAGERALQEIRTAGARAGGPYCRTCGCTDARACPDGCSWQNGPSQPLCSACPAPASALR